MSTATQRSSSPVPRGSKRPAPPPEAPAWLRAIDAVFRFLASLKLAVFSLGTLAAVLAFATWFESTHGTAAVQEAVYRSWWFAVLLAFLATNILCAALIRYPWSRRQTGFVITHAGLLVVLFGAWLTLQYRDEGQVGLLEGEQTAQLVRPDYPFILVRPLDEQGKPTQEYQVPFRPGAFAWAPGRYEVLTRPDDPFKLAVKNFLPASQPRYSHEPAEDGVPMLEAHLLIKPPSLLHEMDLMDDHGEGREAWLKAATNPRREVRTFDRSPVTLAFQYVDTPEKVAAFLDPPADPGKLGIARIRFTDTDGKPQVAEFRLDDLKPGQDVPLPGSDLKATFEGAESMPAMAAITGEEPLYYALFKLRQGDGPAVTHYGWASLPMLANVIPGHGQAGEAPPEPLARIEYFRLPFQADDGHGHAMMGPRGLVEILGGPDGKVYYRYFNDKGLVPGAIGPLALGEPVRLKGGDDSAMSMTLRVDSYLTAGRERFAFVPLHLPKGKLDTGIPAALVEMTVKGQTREFWVRRTGDLDPSFRAILTEPDAAGQFVQKAVGFGPVEDQVKYELAFDADRKPLGFSVKLVDFEVGFDPGTEAAARFQSDVLLTDEAQGIKEKPVRISMNEPMTHNGWTFYQSSYQALKSASGMPTGQFVSVFQVGYDPAWQVKYAGCLLVVLGTFVQFYMRAGLFSDGGKRERERAEARARKAAEPL